MDCDEVKDLQTQKNCDFVVFAEKDQNSWIVPIELKSGKFKASKSAKQLQDGFEIVKGWISHKSSIKVVPLLFRGRKASIHREEIRKLQRLKIKFGNQKYQIYLLKCGDRISKHLN